MTHKLDKGILTTVMAGDSKTPQPFKIDPEEPVYVIGVVSDLVGIPVWTLRSLDREGIVSPKRRAGCTRMYSMVDMQLLLRIRHLMMEKHVNIQGIRIILEIEE